MDNKEPPTNPYQDQPPEHLTLDEIAEQRRRDAAEWPHQGETR